MSLPSTSSPKRKSHAIEDGEGAASYRGGIPSPQASPVHRGSPSKLRGSPVKRMGSPAGPVQDSPIRDSWADYTLLQEMTSVAELNEELKDKLEQLGEAVTKAEKTYALLSGRREEMERDLLDWKNLLVQKVEGCYTQVLGQLLDAFDGLEGEAALNREYLSNMLWATRQLCQASKDAINTPDLDTLGIMRARLSNKITQIESVQEEDLEIKEDVSDWTYNKPEVGDEVIWRLMGTFELGPNILDSTTATPVTTPCQDNSNLMSLSPGHLAVNQNVGKPTSLPIVSVRVNVTDHMDENLNMSGGEVSLTADTPPGPQLLGAFQTRTPTDASRCHPISLAVNPAGDLIIPDKHNKKIKIFTQKGELVQEIMHDDLRSPTYVAVTPDGEIAVCDRKAGDIKVFSMQGQCLAVIPKLFKSPAGIAFTSTGDLLVGDTGRKAVHVVSLQAAAVKTTIRHFRTPVPGTGCKEDEMNQLQWPHCITVSADDVILVSDRTSDVIQMLDVSGRAIGRFGSPGYGKGRLQSPYGTAVGDNGEILVCDYGNHSLQVLTPGGQWKEPLLTSAHGLQFPAAVVFLDNGRLAVSEYLSGIIKIFQLPGHEVKRSNPRPMSPAF